MPERAAQCGRFRQKRNQMRRTVVRRPSMPADSGGGDSVAVAAAGLIEIRGVKMELIAVMAIGEG